jgi:hypothetical protein
VYVVIQTWSTLAARRSSFVVRLAALGVLRSSLVLRRSAGGARRSSCSPCLSSLSAGRTAVAGHRAALRARRSSGAWRSSFVGLLLLVVRCSVSVARGSSRVAKLDDFLSPPFRRVECACSHLHGIVGNRHAHTRPRDHPPTARPPPLSWRLASSVLQ